MSCSYMTANCCPIGMRVLDVGCGTGIVSRELSNRSKDVVAVDHSFESLRELGNNCKDNIRYLSTHATQLPFKDGVFDAVVCANMLQHLEPGLVSNVVSELYRVVRLGGHIVVSVHHYSRRMVSLGYPKEGVWEKQGDPASGHFYVYRFERHEVQQLFPGCTISCAGFYELDITDNIQDVSVQNNIARVSGESLAQNGYGHMLIASAKKC